MIKKNTLFILLLIISCLFILGYFARQNEYSEGGADNYWHYFFSRYAYKYPQFFIHHWGKPIFILLSGPFSQFGLIGIKIFNILCCLASSYVCYRFCKDIELKINWLVIPILIFAPIYFLVSQSALTEPLFSLILILSSYLLYKESFFWGAILASFLVFSRTEGLFIVIYYCFYFILAKKIRYTPLLATAFVAYGFIGLILGHHFFWFFKEMPYAVESPYGHGEWMHFFSLYRAIFGTPHVILLLLGLVSLIINIIRNKELNVFRNIGTNIKVFLLVFMPALLFFTFHVIAWKFGKFGSAGLERVMACIIPCTAILCVYALNLMLNFKIPKWSVYVVAVVCLYFVVSFPFQLYQFPLKATYDEKTEQDAAKWFIKNGKKDHTIYYAHPAIVFYADLDPFDKVHIKECYEYNNDCKVDKQKPYYYFWDSAFSESGCHTTTTDLDSCANLKKVQEFTDNGFRLCIYESIP